MRRTAVAGLISVVTVGVFVTASLAFGGGGPAEEASAALEVQPATTHRTIAAIPTLTPALDDATIVAIFDAANTADIETGRLAAERGSSKEVRDFGAMLARDHQQVRQLGRDLAGKLGVTPTPPADTQAAANHAAAMTRLRKLSGPAFDRAFLRHEAEFHQAVLDAVRSTLLPAITNGELKALVVKVAPAFEAHRLAAEHLEQQLAAGSRTR